MSLLSRVLLFFCLIFCFFSEGVYASSLSLGDVVWAKSNTAGGNTSTFVSSEIDNQGNIISVGYVTGTGSYSFGENVSIAGPFANFNPVIVKYDQNGNALWAKTAVSSSNSLRYWGVAIDSEDNIYVAAQITGNSQVNFGNSVTFTGVYASNVNAVLVKYASDGTAEWAKGAVSGANRTGFWDVTVDSLDRVYATGLIYGSGVYDFGNGITATGGYSGGSNSFVIRYSSEGVAEWAATTVSGATYSIINDVAVDKNFNVYLGGYLYGSGQIAFGNGVTTSGSYSGNINSLIVKFSSNGTAEWARSTYSGSNLSDFYEIEIDNEGNVIGVGFIYGSNQFDFGGSATVSGGGTINSPLAVKYDPNGNGIWAVSTVSPGPGGYFSGIDIDREGLIYISGTADGGTSDYGNGVVLSPTYSTNTMAVIVYNSKGVAQWAKTFVNTPNASSFASVSVDADGSMVLGGNISGVSGFDLGNSISVSGSFSTGTNTFLLKMTGFPPGLEVIAPIFEATSSQNRGQLRFLSDGVEGGVIEAVRNNVDDVSQKVLTVASKKLFNFDAMLSTEPPIKSSNFSGFINPITGSETILKTNQRPIFLGDGKIGLQSGSTMYWQIGEVHNLWYRVFSNESHDSKSPVIIPELQKYPSIIAFSYRDADLVPLGKPDFKFKTKHLKIAHSIDGQTWKVLESSVVDDTNKTVAVIGKVGGYYSIVASAN